MCFRAVFNETVQKGSRCVQESRRQSLELFALVFEDVPVESFTQFSELNELMMCFPSLFLLSQEVFLEFLHLFFILCCQANKTGLSNVLVLWLPGQAKESYTVVTFRTNLGLRII